MDRLATLLAQATEGALLQMMAIPTQISPVESPQGTPVDERGLGLVVGPRGDMSFQGEAVANIEPDLRDRLEAELERMQTAGRSVPLYVWADQATPAATVAQIASVAPDPLELRLLVVGPQPAAASYEVELLKNPRVSAFRDQLDELDPSERATFVARKISKTVGNCAPLVRVFADVDVEPERRAMVMAERTPHALRECQCKVADLDLVEYTLLGLLGVFDRRVAWLPIAEASSVLKR